MALALLLAHVGEEIEGGVVVANVLEAKMMVFALEAVTLGRLVDAGLVATLPGTIGNIGVRLGRMVPRIDADAVEKLGIELHRS